MKKLILLLLLATSSGWADVYTGFTCMASDQGSLALDVYRIQPSGGYVVKFGFSVADTFTPFYAALGPRKSALGWQIELNITSWENMAPRCGAGLSFNRLFSDNQVVIGFRLIQGTKDKLHSYPQTYISFAFRVPEEAE